MAYHGATNTALARPDGACPDRPFLLVRGAVAGEGLTFVWDGAEIRPGGTTQHDHDRLTGRRLVCAKIRCDTRKEVSR